MLTYNSSEQYKRQLSEQKEFEDSVKQDNPFADFKAEVKSQKAKGNRKSSAYTVGFVEQVRTWCIPLTSYPC
jgi:hypothetical protein